MNQHKAHAWLINTGWSGGSHGVGSRMKLQYTRAMIDAIHSGELAKATFTEDPIFRVSIPNSCLNVPQEILTPKNTWKSAADYEATAHKLAGLFRENFKEKYEDGSPQEICAAGPR